MEEWNTKRNVDSGSLAHEIFGVRVGIDSIINWPRSHSCFSLTKNVAAFCPGPENLYVARPKCNGLSFV